MIQALQKTEKGNCQTGVRGKNGKDAASRHYTTSNGSSQYYQGQLRPCHRKGPVRQKEPFGLQGNAASDMYQLHPCHILLT